LSFITISFILKPDANAKSFCLFPDYCSSVCSMNSFFLFCHLIYQHPLLFLCPVSHFKDQLHLGSQKQPWWVAPLRYCLSFSLSHKFEFYLPTIDGNLVALSPNNGLESDPIFVVYGNCAVPAGQKTYFEVTTHGTLLISFNLYLV
jgi:hypothetical protein